jgi:hypothetical protein
MISARQRLARILREYKPSNKDLAMPFTSSESTRALDWFATESEFRQLCGDAQSQAKGESAQDFAAEMVIKANKHGLNCYLTKRQLEYLCTLADWDPPARRKP